MQVAFCAGLERTFARAGLRTATAGNATIRRIGYQDDNYVMGSARKIIAGWEQMEAELELDGHRLRRTKCAAWVPGAEWDQPAGPWATVAKQLAELVHVSDAGIKMLGGAAQGELETWVGPHQLAIEPMRERAA